MLLFAAFLLAPLARRGFLAFPISLFVCMLLWVGVDGFKHAQATRMLDGAAERSAEEAMAYREMSRSIFFEAK